MQKYNFVSVDAPQKVILLPKGDFANLVSFTSKTGNTMSFLDLVPVLQYCKKWTSRNTFAQQLLVSSSNANWICFQLTHLN